MARKLLIVWDVLSVAALVGGYVWRKSDPENHSNDLYFIGWMSTLLVVGYHCTPSHSVYGKFAFGCVALMVIGIAMKIFHLTFANEAIVIGLLGIVASYAAMWFGKKDHTSA